MATCAHCGGEYTQKVREKYCSTECRGAKKSKKVSFKCIVCGETFKTPPARAKLGVAKYCSTDCKYSHFALHLRQRVTKQCEECDKPYEVPPYRVAISHYCSRACYNEARRQREERQCVTCGDGFVVKKSVQDICCSWECRVERLRGENHPSWRGGSIRNYAGDWTRQKRRARERDGNICQECGKTPEQNGVNMSVHHIKPYRTFDDPHEANRLENLISLCMSCHLKKPE